MRCLGTMRRSTIRRRAIDQPRVGVRLARHDRGAEARHGAHDGHAAAPRDRIGAERHAGGARRDHALDQHRRGVRQQRQAVLAAVGEDPIGESPTARPHARVSGTSVGRHVQEALELTGERMLGAVLVAGRRSDGHELAGRRERDGPPPRPRRRWPAPATRSRARVRERVGVGGGFERGPLFRREAARRTRRRTTTNHAGTGSPARSARASARALPPACGESTASAAPRIQLLTATV